MVGRAYEIIDGPVFLSILYGYTTMKLSKDTFLRSCPLVKRLTITVEMGSRQTERKQKSEGCDSRHL